MMKRIGSGLIMCLLALAAFAQTYDENVEAYINQYKDIAIAEMKRTGIPASITLSQGIIESGAGKSPLAMEANNHFGIKCHENWKGETYTYDDDRKNECFRKYETARASFDDHSDFLKNRPRYAVLFTYKPDDYKAWAKGLKSCGYATNPHYANILIKCIEDYDLHQWDLDEKARENWFAEINKSPLKDTDDTVVNANRGDAVYVDQLPLPEHRIYVFHDIKCVTLQEGESLSSLATTFEIGINRLNRYNDIVDNSQVASGDRIYLQPKRNTGDTEFHVVKEGESMFSISRDHGIQLRELYEKNLMQLGTQPLAGETLYLKKKRDSIPVQVNDSPVVGQRKQATIINNSQMHLVARGDTLYSISKKYDIDVNELKKINNLSSDNLYIGDKLRVTK